MTPITIPANSIEKDDVIEVSAKFRANKYRIKMEIETLKIKQHKYKTITATAWDNDGNMEIEIENLYHDFDKFSHVTLNLDQATQLRDWLTKMIEKQELTK